MHEKCRRILKRRERRRDEEREKSKKRRKREEERESIAEDFHQEEELIFDYKLFMLLQSKFSSMAPETLTKLFYTYTA